MTNGIGRINGGNDFGGFGPLMPGKRDIKEEQQAETIVKPETKNVNPDEVMKLLESNNVFVQPKSEFIPVKLSEDTVARIEDSMKMFQATFDAAFKEFGDEEVARGITELMIDTGKF